MRQLALAIFLALALAVASAACGGGNGGESGASDTGATDVAPTDSATEPPATATGGGKPFQISVPKGGLPIGPQSPEKQVVEVQTAMALLGYKVGKPDGVYGDKTLNAVRKFQLKSKLAADGLVGAKTAKAINKALEKANAQA